MGMALFKTEKYEKAFKCFEKVSMGPVSQNPKLWYFMGLCAINLNRSRYEQTVQSAQSDVFYEKLGISAPQF